MAGRRDHLDRQLAELEPVAVGEAAIEILGIEVLHPEHRAEHLLHRVDGGADPDPGAGPLANDRGARQMVGMDVGFEHPRDAKLLLVRRGEDPVDRPVEIRPDAGSKSSTGSMTAAAPVAGSAMR